MIDSMQTLISYTLSATCDYAPFPTIERIGCGQKWLGVKLSDNRCGRSFLFYGEHAVYGPITSSDCLRFRHLIGRTVEDALVHLSECLPIDAARDREDVLPGCMATALVNALAQRVNAPDELEKRGCTVLPSGDFELFRKDDFVVLIGAGMLMQEAVSARSEVHIVDMRSTMLFSTIDITADHVESGPANARFHGPEDMDGLLNQATVCCMTGCTIPNGTFWKLARTLSERKRPPREIVLFGPSAQAPMEVFAKNGITRVAANRITNADAFMDALVNLPTGTSLANCTQSYAVDITGIERDSGRYSPAFS